MNYEKENFLSCFYRIGNRMLSKQRNKLFGK